MLNLFRAEWTKTAGNRWVTGFMLWIFPVGALAFVIVMALMVALVPSMRTDDGVKNLGLDDVVWTEQAISVWDFANSLIGRLIMLAFTSVVFAGEYQWGTWKNIVPRRQRASLMLVKFLTVALFVVFAFTLMSIFIGGGLVVIAEIAGGSHGPRVTGDVVAQFAQDYAQHAGLAFTLALIAASFAALSGMATRSILGGVIVSVIITYAEGLSVLPLALLGYLFDFPKLVYGYRITPSYNVANVKSRITRGSCEAANISFFDDILDFSDSLEFSAVMLAVWVIVLVGLTAYLFREQDITT
ncbi:MAG: ABC transporter permease [Anaerolineae bacterium]|nr:ABC transporter permease [Anaerolineae bacterium]